MSLLIKVPTNEEGRGQRPEIQIIEYAIHKETTVTTEKTPRKFEIDQIVELFGLKVKLRSFSFGGTLKYI